MLNIDQAIALVLSHSILYEQRQEVPEGIPHDWARNDTGSPPPSPEQSGLAISDTVIKNLPALMQIINQQAMPSAAAQYNVAQKYTPKYNALQVQQAQQWLPQLQAIDAASQQAQAQASLSLLGGAGGQLVQQANELDKLINPEYYAGRTALANLGQTWMSGQLTPAEQEAINRSLLNGSVNMGLLGTPSNTQTVANAMQFGNATNQRQQQGAALMSSFLPQSRSQMDVLQTALGRPSNTSATSQFLGVQNPTNPSQNLAQSWLQGLTSLEGTRQGVQQSHNQMESENLFPSVSV